MKLLLSSVFLVCPVAYSAEPSMRPKSRSHILRMYQSFLDVKNERYPELPEYLMKASVQCAEKRDPKACRTLVKGVRAFVEQQKRDLPAVIEQATCCLSEYQSGMKKHAACLAQQHDTDASCDRVREQAAAFLLKLMELDVAASLRLGFNGEFVSLLAEYRHDTCAALYSTLSKRRRAAEHDQPELLYRARMLHYAVRAYRESSTDASGRQQVD